MIETLLERNKKGVGCISRAHDGNALSIVIYTCGRLKVAKWDRGDVNAFRKFALSSDYDHVLSTCAQVLTDD